MFFATQEAPRTNNFLINKSHQLNWLLIKQKNAISIKQKNWVENSPYGFARQMTSSLYSYEKEKKILVIISCEPSCSLSNVFYCFKRKTFKTNENKFVIQWVHGCFGKTCRSPTFVLWYNAMSTVGIGWLRTVRELEKRKYDKTRSSSPLKRRKILMDATMSIFLSFCTI